MSYLITWNPHIHSPRIMTMLYSIGLSISRDCMGREQSRIGFQKQLM